MQTRGVFRPALVALLTLAGCAATPKTAAPVKPKVDWQNVELTLRSLSAANLSDYPLYALRGTDNALTAEYRHTYYARVPLPGYALQISNVGEEPISFEKVDAWIETDGGQKFLLLVDREEIVRRTREQLEKRHPLLAKGRIEIDGTRDALAAIERATRSLPVLGALDVGATIPPHYNWNGVVVPDLSGEYAAKWQALDIGTALKLRMVGIKRGGGELPPAEVALYITHPLSPHVVQCGDGREVDDPKKCGVADDATTVLDGSCVQENVVSASVMGRNIIAPFIGGRVATTTDVTSVLLAEKETRPIERHVWGLRLGGWSLFAAGLFGAGTTIGTLAATGHEAKDSIKGLSFLSLTLVGITMTVVAQKQHSHAVKHFNRVAYQKGLCPDPRSTLKGVESSSRHDRPGDWINNFIMPGQGPQPSAPRR